jgi:hypothetical protein
METGRLPKNAWLRFVGRRRQMRRSRKALNERATYRALHRGGSTGESFARAPMTAISRQRRMTYSISLA